VVEKDQHDPHLPWSLMGVTAPLVTQLTLSSVVASKMVGFPLGLMLGRYPMSTDLSASVQVDKKLCPSVDVFSELLLCSSITELMDLN